MRIFIFLVITIFGISNGYLKEKPEWLKSCRLDQPDIDKCITTLNQDLFIHLADGIKGLEHIGSLDPLKVNKIKLIQGGGPVSLNITLSKAILTGLGKVKVIKGYFDRKRYTWETDIFLPKMRMESNYRMMGQILILPLNGHGTCWMEPINLHVKLMSKSNPLIIDNYTFFNVTHTKVKYNTTGFGVHFTNLFEGVQLLEDSTNTYLNENWQTVEEAMRPIIENAMENIFLDILHKTFLSIPADFFITDLNQ